MDVAAFPILGEPFPVELANTRYGSPEIIDFLGDRLAVPTWFSAVPDAPPAGCPAHPSASWHQQLIDLRDATRRGLEALATATRPADADLQTIASAAALATRRRSIDWSDRPRLVVTYHGPPARRSLAAVADAVLDFLAGSSAPLVRVCEADDCSMLFVKQHHRRRWCHDGCSHRKRQARYYRRRRAAAGRS